MANCRIWQAPNSCLGGCCLAVPDDAFYPSPISPAHPTLASLLQTKTITLTISPKMSVNTKPAADSDACCGVYTMLVTTVFSRYVEYILGGVEHGVRHLISPTAPAPSLPSPPPPPPPTKLTPTKHLWTNSYGWRGKISI